MITLLSKLFIKNKENERQSYGILSGCVGIFFNILLFIGKVIAGILSGSIAITGDAFNNLSDAGSSIITLLGFKFAGQRPDREHPFGHGRMEYIAGLFVSMIILFMGFELAKTSVNKIIHPEDIKFSYLAVIILAVSICVKLYMAYYNYKLSRQFDSPTFKATAVDSVSDSIATTAVLLSMFVSKFTAVNIDPYCGIAVAIFILIAGVKTAKETISPLLGQCPEKELVNKITSIVLSHNEIIGIHDMIIHNYGPGRFMVSLHAEVPANGDLLLLHDVIDNAEHELSQSLGCDAVIHMDPIITDDKLTNDTRQMVTELLKNIDKDITIHDFRLVTGPTHTNLIFDAVVPSTNTLSNKQLKEKIDALVKTYNDNYYTVVTIDRNYIR